VSNINDQIAQRIKAFAAELEALVRRAAIDAVTQSLGTAPARVAVARATGSAPARARASSSGGKRPPAELEAMVNKAGDWIKGNPGQGVEAMAKALGVQTKELALPIAKLLKSKAVKKRGQKRATKYYPG
jgi:uncharacterized heparinase superfamily protein